MAGGWNRQPLGWERTTPTVSRASPVCHMSRFLSDRQPFHALASSAVEGQTIFSHSGFSRRLKRNKCGPRKLRAISQANIWRDGSLGLCKRRDDVFILSRSPRAWLLNDSDPYGSLRSLISIISQFSIAVARISSASSNFRSTQSSAFQRLLFWQLSHKHSKVLTSEQVVKVKWP